LRNKILIFFIIGLIIYVIDIGFNSDNNLNEIFIFYNKNNKLVSLDFSTNYEISNYSYLDELNNAKKIDYSIDFL